MKYQTGQITPLAMWLMGGLGTVVFAFGGWSATQLGGVEDEVQIITNRVTVTEVKINNVEDDISEIKSDLKAIRMLLEEL